MQRYRVECNFGCRYFKDLCKAQKYFNKCTARHLDAELWLVKYAYCPVIDKYSAIQELVAYSATYLPKY